MRSRPVFLSLALLVGTTLAGAAIRFAPLGQPRAVAKYGGSMLWAAMDYWIVSTVWAKGRLFPVALLTLAITCGIECLKLAQTPALDAFRRTLAGVLLLGRFFSLWDMVAYAVAIALSVWVDNHLRPRIRQS